MNEIAAAILLVCPDDVLSFAIFSEIIQKIDGYFDKDMWELKEDASLFEWLLQKQFPLVSEHLKQNSISVEMFLPRWFLTCFGFMPFQVAVRCLDYVLLEGVKALYKLALGSIFVHEEKILSLEGLEQILPYLLSLPCEHLPPEKQIDHVYSQIPIEDFLERAPKFSFKKRFKRSHLRQASR